jgi:hypothetical protein
MKSPAKRTMGQTKFQTLIDYYLGDMRRRSFTDASILTDKRCLERFSRFVALSGKNDKNRASIDHVTQKIVDSYINRLYDRKIRWREHPNRNPEPGKLSPFTIRKEIRILKGFGTWLNRVGFTTLSLLLHSA